MSVRTSILGCVGDVFESMYSHFYRHSLEFFKNSILCRLVHIFMSKFAQKLKFSQSRKGLSSGRVEKDFEASNGITGDLLRRALKFLTRFAF